MRIKKYITSCKKMSPSTLSIIYFLITVLSLFTTIAIAGFLYSCIGSDCEGWQVVLTIFSIIATIICCCLCKACNALLCNENIEERYADIEERGTDNCRNKDTEEISKV